MSFIAIAHRGFSSRAPENTLAAFDLALANSFKNIELDVQLTREKIPVIIHDRNVDRTTDGRGEVSNMSLNHLRRLDAGSWFDPKYMGERIPRLEEVLQRYAGKVHLHLELKSTDPDLAGVVSKTVEDNEWLQFSKAAPFAVPGLTITSAHFEQLKRSLRYLPYVPHHWLSWNINQEIIDKATELGLRGICIASRFADAGLIKQAKQKRLTIRGLDVKDDEDIRILSSTGAEGATTNWPDRVEMALASSGGLIRPADMNIRRAMVMAEGCRKGP